MMKSLIYILLLVLLSVCLNIHAKKSKVVVLDEDNWQQMLEGEWMVEFYAPWCPACKALQPIWKDFADWSDDLAISVGEVDVTTSPGLSGRFMVTALPTIYHVKDRKFRQYRGSRDKEEFMSFIEEKKWESLDEISAWKSPASFQMSIIAQFFKMSTVIREIHTTMVENYGLPNWCSYLAFAIATIIVGTLLGLILVCIIDFLFPPKPMNFAAAPPPPPTKAKAKDSDDEGEEEEEDSIATETDDQTEDDDDDEEEEKEEKGNSAAEAAASSQSENSEPEANYSPSNSPSVRKRKSRKAD